jgi:hypothetical protein
MAADEIRASADPDANVIFGASLTRPAGEDVLITLIATGLDLPKGADDASRAPARRTIEAEIADRTEPAMRPAASGLRLNGGTKREPKVDAPPPRPREVPSAAHEVAEPPKSSRRPAADGPAAQEVDLEVPSFLRRRQSS